MDVTLTCRDQQTFLISTKLYAKIGDGKKKSKGLTLDVFCRVRFANEILANKA